MERLLYFLSCSNAGFTSAGSRRPEIARVKPASANLRAMPRPIPRVPPVTSATLSLSGMVCSEESVVARVGEPGDQQTKLQEMVVAPHAGFAVGDFRVRGNVVPSVRAMVNAVQQQALVLGIHREIRFLQQFVGNGQPGLG